ncbi:B12-binding domain-containing radical SAM protein [Clostridium sp. ZS2-4]|uniref:B12-binding domain-containing radical SAM protein n=1 Tax=Clostridium sp. ZS2-4 TaxID=2987703 RepID=UPI00227BAC70|nr:radical SAM protein [Clostridium sp. ZS2-4]MCY6355335.1 radical SAM protein [Clostridium sp. ZS2-4]
MKKKVLLVYSPMDENYHTEGVNDSLPLGLLYLYNYAIKYMNLDVRIDIIDGEYYSMEEILGMLKEYDLLCVQTMMASYRNTLKMLEVAKQYNITTVLGGHHATQLREQIIMNRNELVDYVIVGDGEEAFVGLIQEKHKESIPNLAYYDKETNSVKYTTKRNFPIDENIVDYIEPKLLEQYYRDPIRNSSLERIEKLSSFRAYSHKGCSNRQNSQYCFFCGRADSGVRFKSPEVYIRELEYIVTIPTIKYIFEIGDDFLQDEQWLEEVANLYQNKLKNSNIKLKIFARANRINDNVIKYLKMLNIDEVAIGFESGSSEILEKINKNATPDDNIKAAKLLFQNGIDTIASYVLGLPGETVETLDQTYQQACYIRELSLQYLGREPQEIISNIIEINPGSPAYYYLKKAYPEKYWNEDLLDIHETQSDYFKMHFNLKTEQELRDFRKMLIGYGKKINKLGKYTYPAGWTKEDMYSE